MTLQCELSLPDCRPMKPRRFLVRPAGVVVPLLLAVAACGGGGGGGGGQDGGDGGNGGDDGPNAALAAEGMQVALRSGCAGCHGANGEGGVGPPWIGLAGSEVVLSDGTTVVADEAYLAASIKTPDAQKVPGYAVAMPVNQLSDADISKVVAYIQSLQDATAAPPSSGPAAPGAPLATAPTIPIATPAP
ncbi:MAG: c-type cytochrome [Ilumatobacteraceae bacterium]